MVTWPRVYLWSVACGGDADFGQDEVAAEGAAGQEEVAGLAAVEGDGQFGGRDLAARGAGGAVEAGGHIDGDDTAGGGEDGGDGGV